MEDELHGSFNLAIKMHDLSSQKTRKFVIASIVWVGLSLLLADTYGEWGLITEDFEILVGKC